jgi:hypothetical protein
VSAAPPNLVPENPSTPSTAASSGSPSPKRTGPSSGAKAGIAVAVVAVIVFAALAAGVVPGVSLFGSSGSGNGVSSSTATEEASGVAAAHGVGSLLLLIGAATTYAFSFGEVSGNSTCSVTDPLSSNFTVPASTGGYASGQATVWLLLYANASGPSESLIAVVGSATYFLGTVTGSDCFDTSGLAALTGTYVSSTQAAAALDADAGSFVNAHGQANALYVLIHNTTSAPEWLIAYTNCSYDPATNTTTGGSDADLVLGVVNGTDGSVVGAETSDSLNCSAALASNLSQPLGAGPAVRVVGGPEQVSGTLGTTAVLAVVSSRGPEA